VTFREDDLDPQTRRALHRAVDECGDAPTVTGRLATTPRGEYAEGSRLEPQQEALVRLLVGGSE
jgi:hypothetical protein